MKKWDRRRVKPQPKFCKPKWLMRDIEKAGLKEFALLWTDMRRSGWRRLIETNSP